MTIHPTALVDPQAELAADVEVGAFSIIGPHVRLAAGCKIAPHVLIAGHTTLGANNTVHSFCSLGSAPQDKKYRGEPTELLIGNDNTFFQNVTIATGTTQDRGITRIGDGNWVMAYAHIAHDCIVGNHIILANGATLAGHVEVGDYVILGGLAAVHQFCVIGAHAMGGGGATAAPLARKLMDAYLFQQYGEDMLKPAGEAAQPEVASDPASETPPAKAEKKSTKKKTTGGNR